MAHHLCLGPLLATPTLEGLLLHVGPPGLRAEGSVTRAVSPAQELSGCESLDSWDPESAVPEGRVIGTSPRRQDFPHRVVVSKKQASESHAEKEA